MPNQEKPSNPLQDARETIGIFIGLMQALAMPARVWWTRFGTAGEMFFGGRLAVIGWLIVPLFPMCVMPARVDGIYAFWGLTTLLMLVHRFRGWQLRRRGYRPHSYFAGLPRFGRSSGFWAAATSGLGLVLLGWDKALGLYLFWAGFAIAVSTGYAREVERGMIRRMRDARREQEWMAEQMQGEE